MALDESISPGQSRHIGDHEDLAVRYNLTQPIGELWFSTAVETVVGSGTVFVKALGTTTLETDPAAIEFTMPASNRLTYTGTDTRTMWVSCTFSAIGAGTNQLLAFALAQDGTVAAKTMVQRQVGTGSDEGAGSVHGLFTMATNSYLELWVTNQTSAQNVTINHGDMSIVSIS
jgi:hypothetical protein